VLPWRLATRPAARLFILTAKQRLYAQTAFLPRAWKRRDGLMRKTHSLLLAIERTFFMFVYLVNRTMFSNMFQQDILRFVRFSRSHPASPSRTKRSSVFTYICVWNASMPSSSPSIVYRVRGCHLGVLMGLWKVQYATCPGYICCLRSVSLSITFIPTLLVPVLRLPFTFMDLLPCRRFA